MLAESCKCSFASAVLVSNSYTGVKTCNIIIDYGIKQDCLDILFFFQGPGGHVSREEYLLGRKIDKAFEQLEQNEATENLPEGEQLPQQNKPAYTIEHGLLL